MNVATQPTAVDYARIFEAECAQTYPAVDAFEQRCGYAVDLVRLSAAARVLACPLKANPPNWQHGRVIYSVARKYFETVQSANELIKLLDVGTAKGFSALCLYWALEDSGRQGRVVSVDVIDPVGTERRNTVAEIAGSVTLRDILEPWPESADIAFLRSTGIDYLQKSLARVHLAFVDGKHTGPVVSEEARLLASRQIAGDVVIFDDAQIPAVAAAIEKAQDVYELKHLTAKPGRTYVIARRR